jgi:hypothetical protein
MIMKLRYYKLLLLATGIVGISSCKKTFDINNDPDRLPATNNPIPQLLTSAQVNLGFEGGSDLFRYATVIMQMMSGEASQPNQTYEYYRYNITGSDQNNVWSSIFATTLNDLELIIQRGGASPYYTGIAKILKAYEYSLVVDVWGKVPFTETQLTTANTQPHYDDDAVIYPKLVQLLTDGIADLNAASSLLTPSTNSVIYTGTFSTIKTNWIKLANTLKLRLALHYSKVDPVKCLADINTLVGGAGPFMAANADNFSMAFYDVANQRNPISAFEVSRPNYLFCDARMLGIMTGKGDPRRPYYFTSFPYQGIPLPITLITTAPTVAGNVLQMSSTTGALTGMVIAGTNIPPNTTATGITATSITLSANVTGAGVGGGANIIVAPNTFTGVSAATPPAAANNNFSRIHTFLRGAVNPAGPAAPPFLYTGAAPQRMVSFAEYNFIRAEAALRGASAAPLANAEAWYRAGITASMQEVGVSAVQIADYLVANGPLSGTFAIALQQIIEEKYIALFGVSVEPWSDWRRTGYPALTVPVNAINGVSAVPRTLFYPQSEIDLNPNCPGQKAPTLQNSVFWDN